MLRQGLKSVASAAAQAVNGRVTALAGPAVSGSLRALHSASNPAVPSHAEIQPKITMSAVELGEVEDADFIAVPFLQLDEGIEMRQEGLLSAADSTSLMVALEAAQFKAAKEETHLFSILTENGMKHFLAVGTGKENGTDDEEEYEPEFYATVAKNALKMKAKKVAVVGPEMDEVPFRAVMESFFLAAETTGWLKSKKDDSPAPHAMHVAVASSDVEIATDALKSAEHFYAGASTARKLVNLPSNIVSPSFLADFAQNELGKSKGMEVKVMDRDECNEMGMGAYLAVAEGSSTPPKFIHVTYKGEGEIEKNIALVGKGVTFDSGGYNLKPTGSQIEIMKMDMGGAAAVLGAADIIRRVQPENTEAHFIIAACENMISGAAYRPGDVIRASNGKTIEVENHLPNCILAQPSPPFLPFRSSDVSCVSGSLCLRSSSTFLVRVISSAFADVATK
uniref:Cytosol aminopeptidase domain-containing protein n=2 Tax=Palpitomonas bilix TaxID=652834 RepID=A0A7S3G1V1_9EUKA|mmetsp:Transcript_18946/g.48296  ORF Transcript_18946/g.48296 Transcript_18946/m.48296 type:complete len:451 (+) Transcript_18946:76-1428(+)